MEGVCVVSMAGVSAAPALGASSCSTSGSSSARLLIRQSDFGCGRPRALPRSGSVKALVFVQIAQTDPRRSAFGRGSVSSRPARMDVRGQASKQTFSSFDDMLQNCGVPVLVDFYAVWCGPCQMMVPILNEVSGALKDKVRVVKIDTEKYPDLASRFNVHALPTLVLFKNGQVADRVEGALRADELINRIQQTL